MKAYFVATFAAFFIALISGCKKDTESIDQHYVTAYSTDNDFVSSGTLGRQKIIQLPTGDYTYPVSQALLWVPHSYSADNDKKKKQVYPLIINLYGQEQTGTNLQLLLKNHTMSEYIAQGFNANAVNPVDHKTYSFFVCSPQCPVLWGWSAPQVEVMLKELQKKLPIDNSRIYITGFSAGGWGLWSCMTDDDKLTKQIAAIVPMSSAAADHPDKITNVDKYGIACLNVCGDQDAFYTNAVDYTNIINSDKPPIPAILNTLKGVGHSAWVQAYDPTWKQTNGLNIYEWMLQYKNKKGNH